MDCWNDKDCPMWMIHLMVCLEWLLNNAFTLTTNYLCYIHTHDLTWNGLDMCSKLWSKCLPFRACLWAFLSAFYWRFCLVGLSVYSYPGLEAHVCDGLSGCKQYVSCVRLLLLLFHLWVEREWVVSQCFFFQMSISVLWCDSFISQCLKNVYIQWYQHYWLL